LVTVVWSVASGNPEGRFADEGAVEMLEFRVVSRSWTAVLNAARLVDGLVADAETALA
jgi:hypothetical protein